jgi:hypothetical protein
VARFCAHLLSRAAQRVLEDSVSDARVKGLMKSGDAAARIDVGTVEDDQCISRKLRMKCQHWGQYRRWQWWCWIYNILDIFTIWSSLVLSLSRSHNASTSSDSSPTNLIWLRKRGTSVSVHSSSFCTRNVSIRCDVQGSRSKERSCFDGLQN